MSTINFSENPGGSEQQSGRSNENSQSGSQQDTSFDNPQRGESWDNYQTKELSGNSGEGALSAEEAAKVFENDNENS